MNFTERSKIAILVLKIETALQAQNFKISVIGTIYGV